MDAELITSLNSMIVLLFCALSAYQYIYILVSVLFPSRRFAEGKAHRFAMLVCARNEEGVIAQLIDSIKKQDYPSDLIDIYVLADNCTDGTAVVAAEAGVIISVIAELESQPYFSVKYASNAEAALSSMYFLILS